MHNPNFHAARVAIFRRCVKNIAQRHGSRPYSFPPAPLDGCGSLLLGQRGESEVWLDDAELGKQSLGLLVLDAGVDDNVITRNPIDWGGDTVLVAGLEGVDNTEDLGGVTAR